MTWAVTMYRRSGDDRLVADYPLRRPSVKRLRELFAPSGADDQVVLSYPIESDDQRAYVEAATGQALDDARYVYYLESFSPSRVGAPRTRTNGVTRRIGSRVSRA